MVFTIVNSDGDASAQPDAMRDEWSGDTGCGVKYFSQDGVIKLAPGRGSSWMKAPLPPRS